MTATEQIIQDAIDGGWGKKYLDFKHEHFEIFEDGISYGINPSFVAGIEEFLLDPLFWQAVGKTRGWIYKSDTPEHWRKKWHTFIDHLAEGDTYEEALKAIN